MMRPTSILMLTLAAAAVLPATTLERLSMTDMAGQSTVVVRATVTTSATEFVNGAVSTHYQLNVAEVWKGSAGTQIDVYVPGGRAGGFRELVPGAPVMDVGSEYVVFLWSGRTARPQIMGLSQGLFAVTQDKSGIVMLERSGAKETMIDPSTGRSVIDETLRMKAADVKSLVRKRAGTK